MPAGNRGPRSYQALLALAAVGCAALLGAGSPAAHASGTTTTLSNDVVHNLSYATPAAQVEAAFGTPINNYTANGRSFYANTLAPKVPASLGISNVFGLNSWSKLHVPRAQATGATKTTAVPTSGNVPKTGLLSIRDLW